MKNSNRSFALSLVAFAALAAGVGCAQTPVEEHWGEAYRTNKMNMIANPDVQPTPAGPQGLDPLTGEAVLENYRKNQVDQEELREEIFLIEQ